MLIQLFNFHFNNHHLSFSGPNNCDFMSCDTLTLPSPLCADASAAVLGGPGSPLAVRVSDVNRDYVFLTWQPPSADGDSPVDGYYVERWGSLWGDEAATGPESWFLTLEIKTPEAPFSSCSPASDRITQSEPFEDFSSFLFEERWGLKYVSDVPVNPLLMISNNHREHTLLIN